MLDVRGQVGASNRGAGENPKNWQKVIWTERGKTSMMPKRLRLPEENTRLEGVGTFRSNEEIIRVHKLGSASDLLTLIAQLKVCFIILIASSKIVTQHSK